MTTFLDLLALVLIVVSAISLIAGIVLFAVAGFLCVREGVRAVREWRM